MSTAKIQTVQTAYSKAFTIPIFKKPPFCSTSDKCKLSKTSIFVNKKKRDEISPLVISRILPAQYPKKLLQKFAILDIHSWLLQSKASIFCNFLQKFHHDFTGNSELIVLKTLPVYSLNIIVGNHDFMHPPTGFSVR